MGQVGQEGSKGQVFKSHRTRHSHYVIHSSKAWLCEWQLPRIGIHKHESAT